MIIARTPFRITLGGGGTDLPSYYENYGGFIFSFCLSKYMYVCLNRPSADNLIRLKYSISETVDSVNELKHDIQKLGTIIKQVDDNLINLKDMLK